MASKNDINTNYAIEVAAGGTGAQSFVAYSPVCGGTTSTNPLQSVASAGTTGQILFSNGAGQLPSYQTPDQQNDFIFLARGSVNGASTAIEFSLTADFSNYLIVVEEAYPTADNGRFVQMAFSEDGGSTYVNTGYYAGINYLALGSNTINNTSVSNDSQWILSPGLNIINPRYCARINLYNVNNGGHLFFTGESEFKDSGGSVFFGSLLGWNGNSSTANKLKIYINSGNWVANILLYGFGQ